MDALQNKAIKDLRTYYFSLILLAILFSCSNTPKETCKVIYINDESKDSLVTKLIGLPVMALDTFYNGELQSRDSFLFIKSQKTRGTYHVFDFNNLFYLCSFGPIGQGPGELAPSSSLIKTTEFKDYNIWVYDTNSNMVKLFSLINLFYNRKENIIIKQHRVLTTENIITNLFVFDSLMTGSSLRGEGRFFIYPIYKGAMKWIPYPDSINKKLTSRSKGLIFYSTMAQHQFKYVNALWNFNVIEIYNQDFKLETKIIGNQKSNLMNQLINEDGNINYTEKRYYVNLHLTDSLIFAVRHDVLWDQLLQSDYKSKILVFNWDGLLRYRFEFDHPITSIVYDSKRGRILASSYSGERSFFYYNTGKLCAH